MFELQDALNLLSEGTEIGVLGFYDLAELLVRVVIAVIFLDSVKNKLPDMNKFAKNEGIPMYAAYFQVLIELIGGLLVLFGILTQIGALLIMIAMIGAMFFHIFVWKSKYWAQSGGWEYDLMIFALAAMLLVTAGGDLAIYPSPEAGALPFVK